MLAEDVIVVLAILVFGSYSKVKDKIKGLLVGKVLPINV